MRLKTLAAKIGLILGIASGVLHAQMVVTDPINLVQNIISAGENVAQTLKQIEQYKTQLNQYQNMLTNTMAPKYTWDEAQSTINNLLQAIDTLNYYKQQVGSIDAYMGKFQDLAYYRNAEYSTMMNNRAFASESQKKANDALFKGLDQQQSNLKNDAKRLRHLQSGAEGAEGQMQALGFANQFASQQANQLLQIRALLIAQQNAMATQMHAQNDKAAQEAALSEKLRGGKFRPSPMRKW